MKNTLFALIALVCVGSVAHADNGNIRLQKTTSPIRLPGGATTTLNVYNDGTVTSTTCRAVYPTPCQTKFVDQLNANQMNRIDNMIERARGANLVTKTGVHCMAMSVYNVNYTADNGTVFLQSVAVPCGLPTYNASLPGVRLVNLLDRLSAQSNNLPQ